MLDNALTTQNVLFSTYQSVFGTPTVVAYGTLTQRISVPD